MYEYDLFENKSYFMFTYNLDVCDYITLHNFK